MGDQQDKASLLLQQLVALVEAAGPNDPMFLDQAVALVMGSMWMLSIPPDLQGRALDVQDALRDLSEALNRGSEAGGERLEAVRRVRLLQSMVPAADAAKFS